ncbi:hypothetical protein ACQ4M4_28425 [Leptolyngbya sp. AN02str]|uniref:hypothetical protein n=1 Tax=Leptolyngbya sp. AN02str TaxID=3423363 RepID=UPI003D311495
MLLFRKKYGEAIAQGADIEFAKVLVLTNATESRYAATAIWEGEYLGCRLSPTRYTAYL